MTAYLSANLRHTDKRLQQSGPAVVAWRHRVRARRGAWLMNIHEMGGDMTSCRLKCPRAPCWGFYLPIGALINAFFSVQPQIYTSLWLFSEHTHKQTCVFFLKNEHGRINSGNLSEQLCRLREGKTIKIETDQPLAHSALFK